MITLVILLIALILCLGFFAGVETGFLSWNPLKVAHAASQGNLTARVAMRLVNRRGQVLSATLIGINVCNIAAAMVFGVLYGRIDRAVALDLSVIPSPESWFLTPIVLLFGEIIPKSLYRIYPFNLTMKSIPALAVFYFAVSPLCWVFSAVSRVFGGSGESRNADVREEIVLVAVEGAKRGNIFESADRIMKNTLGMKGRQVGSISAGLDEWRRSGAAYRSSQMIGEYCSKAARERGGPAAADEVVVFDDAMKAPIGYVSLIDAAAHRGGSGGMRTFGSLVKPLPRLRGGMEILSCLRRMPAGSPRYHLVFGDGDDGVIGILDKMALFETAFSK